MRRRRAHGHSSRERWLVSYADFITLLFAFFVVLYASSQVDHRKVGKLSIAIQTAFQELGALRGSAIQSVETGEPIHPPGQSVAIDTVNLISHSRASNSVHPDPVQEQALTKLQHNLEYSLASEIQQKEVALRRGQEGLIISLREVGFFSSGSAHLKRDSASSFDRVAVLLSREKYIIRVEGHSDNVPVHNTQYASNWELSAARAIEVMRLLVVRYQIDPALLSVAGYAEFHPVTTNENEDGRSQNRRVDLVVVGVANG